MVGVGFKFEASSISATASSLPGMAANATAWLTKKLISAQLVRMIVDRWCYRRFMDRSSMLLGMFLTNRGRENAQSGREKCSSESELLMQLYRK